MKCRHEKVRDYVLKQGPQPNGPNEFDYCYSCICPDCDGAIEVSSNIATAPALCRPSFRKATWSMAGCGDYWKEWDEPKQTFLSKWDKNPALMLET